MSDSFSREIDKIDHTLSEWETVKGAHGLSPEIIEDGKRVLTEEKEKKK